MTAPSVTVERVLVAHPDAATRQSMVQAVRALGTGAVSVYEAVSLTDAIEKVHQVDPRLILLDLTDSRKLALDVVRALRRADRLILGLYNPMVVGEGEGELLRNAARAGVGDFLMLPLSTAELADAVGSSPALQPQAARPREGHTVSFFSAKGGVGTTTLAAHTGMVLAGTAGSSGVVLCDAHLQFGTIPYVLGLEPDRDLSDLVAELDHPGPLESYLTLEPHSGLAVLPAPVQLSDADGVSPEDLSRVLIALRRRHACVLVDLPPVIDLLTLSVLDLSERVVMVVDNVGPAVLETARALALLQDQGISSDRIRVVINQPAPFPAGYARDAIEEELGLPVLAEISFDNKARAALSRGESLTGGRSKSPFARGVATIAEEVGPGGSGLPAE